MTALHTQLLAKHKDLEALEAHLNKLHTGLMLLGIQCDTAAQQQRRPMSGVTGVIITLSVATHQAGMTEDMKQCLSSAAGWSLSQLVCSSMQTALHLLPKAGLMCMLMVVWTVVFALTGRSRDSSRPASATASTSALLPPAVDLAEARRAHAAAAERLAGLQDQMAQMDQQIESNEAETQDLLVSTVPRLVHRLPLCRTVRHWQQQAHVGGL